MNQPLTHAAAYMSHFGRTVRENPTNTIPLVELHAQTERLLIQIWELSQIFGFDAGPHPQLSIIGQKPKPIEEILGRLIVLETEILTTFLMLGLGTAYESGLFELGLSLTERRVPDYRRVIDDMSSSDGMTFGEWEEGDN